MLLHLVGIAELDFMSNDGKPIKGTQLFVNHADPSVNGLMATKLFVGSAISLPALTPGINLDVQFNHKGKIISVAAAKG